MHSHDHHSDKAVSAIRLAFILNVGFTLIEIAGGLYTNSISILADAVHDLGDSLSLGLAWWFESVSRKKSANDSFTYGYNRLSLLASFINAVVLSVGSTLIFIKAIPRLFEPESGHADGMILLAVLGVVINGYAALKTSHGKSLNENVISWHLLEDVLGWVAVLAGAVIIRFTDWWWIDAALAIAIALFILTNIVRRLWKIGRLFLQVSPEEIDVGELRESISSLEGVEDVHHLHVWSLDGEHNVATVHVLIDDEAAYRKVKTRIRDQLAQYEFSHVAIEIDLNPEDCSTV